MKLGVRILLACVVISAPASAVAVVPPDGGAAEGTHEPLGSTDTDEGVTQTAAEALAADMDAIRRAHGWTTAQLAGYQASEQALDEITGLLSTKYPEAFVGSAINDDPAAPPTVYVKGPAPDEIRALAAALGVTVVDDQPYSLEDLDARLATIHDAMLAAGFDQVVGSADIRRQGAITLVVSGAPRDQVDLLLARMDPDILKDLTLIEADGPVAEPQGAYGGMALRDSGVFLCTSGFTVFSTLNTSVRGVSGAGHCNGINEIVHPNHAVHGALQQVEHQGQWGDVEWYTTAQAEQDDFYADQNQVRDVAAVEPRANIAIGEAICVYGRASNSRNCSLVVENPNVFCGLPQKLVQMNGAVTIGGDSGGGWTNVNTAYGGHYGICFNKSSFSVADLFDEAINVRVAVN